jgi:hypothetical protein
MRIQVDWTKSGGVRDDDTCQGAFGHSRVGEASAARRPTGQLRRHRQCPATGTRIFQQTIGIGYRYLHALPSLTFRFPELTRPFAFTLRAESETSGAIEEVLKTSLDPATFATVPKVSVETIPLRAATQQPALFVNIYSEGYTASGREKFLTDARNVVRIFETTEFPNQERFELRAVWSSSPVALGSLGGYGGDDARSHVPVPDRACIMSSGSSYCAVCSAGHFRQGQVRSRRVISAIAETHRGLAAQSAPSTDGSSRAIDITESHGVTCYAADRDDEPIALERCSIEQQCGRMLDRADLALL